MRDPLNKETVSPQIVAEIGSNFAKFETDDENLDCAVEQVIAARDCGATAVKFQLFTAHELFGDQIPDDKAEELEKFVPNIDQLNVIAGVCKSIGIEFQCTAFSVLGYQAIDSLVKRHKIASPEYSDPHLLKWLQHCGKPVIYSLGCFDGRIPTIIWNSEDIFLECVSKYPADFMEYDLNRMLDTPRWGISDHTMGADLAFYARSMGAMYFEKHVDFFYGEGKDTPDTCVSCTGEEFLEYVHAIKSSEVLDRDAIKKASNKKYGRKEIKGKYYRPYEKE